MARKHPKQAPPIRTVTVKSPGEMARLLDSTPGMNAVSKTIERSHFVPQRLDLDTLRELTVELIRQGHPAACAVEAADEIYRRLDALMATYYAAMERAAQARQG